MMVTCFPFIVTVLSILRQAIGLQQAPPNMMIVSLALFLTYFVMEPVFTAAWTNGVQPLLDGVIDQSAAIELIIEPFRAFMTARVDPVAIETLLDAAPARRPEEGAETPFERAGASFHAVGNSARVRDRVHDFSTLSCDRSGRRLGADGDGHDDGAARGGVAAIQAGVLRHGGWMGVAGWRAGHGIQRIKERSHGGGRGHGRADVQLRPD